MSRLHYLYEEAMDRSEKRRFVYFCSECQCILNVCTELEPVGDTVEALENRCPGCGATLEASISCESSYIREAWSEVTRSVYSTRKVRTLVIKDMFKPAVTVRGFYFNFAPLDRLVGCIDPGWLVAFTGECANTVAEFLCFRAQLPKDVGGLDSSVVLIDGGNRSDLHLFSSFAKLQGVAPRKALRRVVTSRTFTMYQLADLVTHDVLRAIDEYGAEMVMISDVLGMLDESELREDEARRTIDGIWAGMRRILKEKKVFVFTTLVTKTSYDERITDHVDVLVNLEQLGSNVKGTLLKHPFRGTSSTQFRPRELLRPSPRREAAKILGETRPPVNGEGREARRLGALSGGESITV